MNEAISIGKPPILDGLTGKPITVDGEDAVLHERPEAQALVTPPFADLAHSLADAIERVKFTKAEKKKVAADHREAQDLRDEIIEEIVKHYGVEGAQLAMGLDGSDA